MTNLEGAFVRRQEIICTEDEMNIYANAVLLLGEPAYIKMNDGSIRQKIGDNVTRLVDLPYTDNGAERVAVAADEAEQEIEAATQEAVDHLLEMAEESLSIVQTIGESETSVMSQNATTNTFIGTCGNNFHTPCNIYSGDEKLFKVNHDGDGTPKFYVSNKNLLPQFPTETKSGVTLTKNDDGTITFNGTATGTFSFILSYNVVLPVQNGIFTLSLNNSATIGDEGFFAEFQSNDQTVIKCWADRINAFAIFSIAENEPIDYFRIRIPSGMVFNNFTLGVQVEEGAWATGFVKHESHIVTLNAGENTVNCFKGYNYLCATKDYTVSGIYLSASNGKNIGMQNKFKDKTIVCFGDSITGNYVETDYPSIIAKLTGANVYNVGFGGCTMSYHESEPRREFSMCRLVDSIVAGNFSAQENSGVSITLANGDRSDYVPMRIEILKAIDWAKVDYITIAYGTNDWNSNYMIDNEENPLDISSYIGAFRYSIKKLLTAYPNIKILVMTPLWRWWDETAGGVPYRDSDNYAKGTGWYLYDYGNALIEACKEYHIPCLDLYYECMFNKFNRYEYFNANDGTHPKDTGREVIGGKISAKLYSTY